MAKENSDLRYLGECIREGFFKLAEAINRKTDLDAQQNKKIESFHKEAQKIQKTFLNKLNEHGIEGEEWRFPKEDDGEDDETDPDWKN